MRLNLKTTLTAIKNIDSVPRAWFIDLGKFSLDLAGQFSLETKKVE